ncbi:universal stress protein [Halobacteria archaeon AArc-m2/3/4]|uniref:Universal stress protein n=1 Tax=Natronoglomus mannanivorans TaxID=2979990 RepID=A0AAP2YX73_9EURY|nr:universal stress protein [Halobacteria archaeon AArc-xg1-1]MCU4972410.1 universal stress protein [Halobacteria archaeon AArc-m2/3/4]
MTSKSTPNPRHLLVPMDDSEPARAALEHALTIFPDDEITVVHAVDELEAQYGGQSGPDGEPDLFADVDAIAAEHETSVETVVIDGTAADAILEYVDREGVDQLIMGSEGRSGVSRMLLGSVAEQVTRRSPVPVTIVR